MPKPTDKPPANEYGKFKSAMNQIKGKDGKKLWKTADIDAAMGGHVSGKTWKEHRDKLIEFLRKAPKAKEA
ncbi:MAG: hypothetical protein GY820_38865 [Gammaproteobacteria bacterium]|nr:hypothetical protein [Gammaproteobacteria bacterium]